MKIVYILLFIFCGNYLFAATKVWDGGASTSNWEDANNWSDNTLPTSLDSVIIKNESVEISTVQNIKSLRLEDGASAILTINKTGILIVAGGAGTGMHPGYCSSQCPCYFACRF